MGRLTGKVLASGEVLCVACGRPPAGIGVVRRACRTDAGVDRGGDRMEATADPGAGSEVDVLHIRGLGLK